MGVEANLFIQVHAVLEQSRITSSRVPNRSSLARRPVKVISGPVVYPTLYVGTQSLALHADRIVEDVRHGNRAEELEVGKKETVTELEVGWLRPLCTGPS